MKRLFYSIFILLLGTVLFSACIEDTPEPKKEDSLIAKSAYIINYGNFGSGGAEITKFDLESNSVTNNYYSTKNDGFELLSNIQFAGTHNDSIYLLGNNNDQLIALDTLFMQKKNGVSEDLANPRYFVGHDNMLFISCLGESPDWDEMPDSYIAVYDITKGKVSQKISIPGGPEGMAIANEKLYVALNYTMKIAVVDLISYNVSYIETPAVTSYFAKDNDNNLYVSLVSTFSDYSDQTGLAYINTSNDEITNTYMLEGVSTSYGSIISANDDFSKIYVLASQYDENFNLSGSVQSFDVKTETFTTFINDIAGPSGVICSPVDNKIFVLSSESVTEGGKLKIYTEDGVFENEFVTGISPTMAFFLF